MTVVPRFGAKSSMCDLTLEGHEGAVLCVCSVGVRVLTSSSDRSARLWDLKTGSCERVLSHNGPVVSASFGPAGQVLTASSDRTARLWSYDGDAL